MRHEGTIFALLVVCSYAVAFFTSHALVRWVLPRRLSDELGRGNRYVALDGIRGYLAFGVYLHHCLVTWVYLATAKWGPPPLDFENELGEGAVAIFFMITAFLFWGRVYARKDLDSTGFFISRLFRVYPLYLFVLVILLGAVGYKTHWVAHESHGKILSEIAQWSLFQEPDVNNYGATSRITAGVTWTLLYEAWFYLSLPLMVVIFLKQNAIWKKVLSLVIVVALSS
jgi:peptidoglycan/LPS O-acetylase OafA/YrhL